MKTYKILYLYSCFLNSRIPAKGLSADFIRRHMNEFCSDTVMETSDKWEAFRVFAAEYSTGTVDDTVIDYCDGGDCTAVEFFQLIEMPSGKVLLSSDLN